MTMNERDTFDDRLRTYRKATTEVNAFNKTLVFEALSQAGIQRVRVTFDGCGDSGQIEEIVALINEALVDFPDAKLTVRTTSFGVPEFTTKEMSVEEAVVELCYGYLRQEHDGWEINDGSFGEFTLNVAERRIWLNFNARFTDYVHSTHAF
jgi:hypothetical protein